MMNLNYQFVIPLRHRLDKRNPPLVFLLPYMHISSLIMNFS